RPAKGGITLNVAQRVQLRVFSRFMNEYVTLPRGAAKTHGNMLGEFHEAIWFPKLYNSMSAETKEQSAKILKEKWNEILAQFPALKNELLDKPNFSKDTSELRWKNGSKTDNLANSHSVKGLRRHRLRIEESARVNNELFDDALKPVADTVRYTAGNGLQQPKELTSSIHFFSTTTFKNCSEHIRTNQMIKEMCECKGSFVFGADWRMPVQFGMKKKSSIEKEKKNMNPVAFNMNYGMLWVGASDDALVNMQTMMDIRTVNCASLEPIKGREYVIGVDVAKSKDAKNNNTIMVVLGFTRNKDNSIKNIYMEYMKKVTSGGTYTAQSLELKRIHKVFNPIAIVVDAQSYGQGFIEACTKAEVDPLTNKITEKFATFNDEGEYGQDIVGDDALPIIYALKSSHAIETQIIVNFQGWIQSNKFHIPCDNNSIEFTKEVQKDEKMKMEIEKVHVNASNFIEEVANLKAEKLENGKLKIRQIVRADKDRYSATTYSLYYLNKFENIVDNTDEVDLSTRQRCVTSLKF
ncbi:MAG: hypothetical protein WCR27_10585, partial [Eubacteriales bacterium]